ncbi:hypothetical protein EIQ06_05550 [Xanthomonas campestris pv. campestris]
MSSHQQMVNGDIDNCDGARYLAVEAITPQRLGLPDFLRDAAVSCASARGWGAVRIVCQQVSSQNVWVRWRPAKGEQAPRTRLRAVTAVWRLGLLRLETAWHASALRRVGARRYQGTHAYALFRTPPAGAGRACLRQRAGQ